MLISYGDFQGQSSHISEKEEKEAVYSHLAQAIDDIKHGRVQSADDAVSDILVELKSLDI